MKMRPNTRRSSATASVPESATASATPAKVSKKCKADSASVSDAAVAGSSKRMRLDLIVVHDDDDNGEVIQSPLHLPPPSPLAMQQCRPRGTMIQLEANAAAQIPNSPKPKHNILDQKKAWDPKDASQVTTVKESLHLSAVPTAIICREEEINSVFEFCKLRIEKKQAGSMYVCGCPGTGKSLMLEKVKALSIEWAKEVGVLPPSSATVNCTSLTNANDLYRKIIDQLQGRKKCSKKGSSFQDLKNIICEKKAQSSSRMILIIVDEMDYLVSKDQSVLYDLFRLPTLQNSNCILIGISNAIDLTDRLLPKLHFLNCTPLVVTFCAYSKDQILKILQQRLMDLPYQAFQPEALELCARKVAAASGDMRKALHVCRNALELFESEWTDGCESDSSTIENPASNEKETPLTHMLTNLVRIDHMARALAKTFKSAVVDTMQCLPLHQQVVLCSAVKCFRFGKKDSLLGELQAAYLKFCKTNSMCPLTGSEFSSICRVLSDQGLLALGKSKEDRLKRVTLRVDEVDVTFALQGIRFFRNSLE